MRTLNRPMFNMGGPIKEGVMHGIREPHVRGQIVGGGINAAKWLASQAGKTFGNVGRTYNIGNIGVGGGAGRNLPMVIKQPGWGARIAEKWKAMPSWFRSSVERDPAVGAALWTKRALTSPTAKGIGQKIVRGVGTPTGVIGAGYIASQFWPDGTKKTKDELAAEGQHGPFDHTDKKKIAKATAAFAEAQRDTRVKKYLDMMGYDRSKKTAVADALIDASKIVSDRGTLETKNITRDLINPIIQATSKRFDKPEQIREAVGLMSVKAAIEKDLEDPQVKKLRALQIEKGELDLERGFETDMRNLLLSRKDKVNKKTLEQFARLTADKYGEPFTQVTEDTDLTTLDNGIYMSEDKIIRVTDGVPKRIV
jgi:hypothetical protein